MHKTQILAALAVLLALGLKQEHKDTSAVVNQLYSGDSGTYIVTGSVTNATETSFTISDGKDAAVVYGHINPLETEYGRATITKNANTLSLKKWQPLPLRAQTARVCSIVKHDNTTYAAIPLDVESGDCSQKQHIRFNSNGAFNLF